MTGPQPAGTDRVVEHAAQLYALEEAARLATAGPLRTALARIVRAITRGWITRFGTTKNRADQRQLRVIVDAVRGDLGELRPDASRPLAAYAVRAYRLGVEQAADEVLVDVDLDAAEADELPDDVLRAVDELDDTIGRHLADADRALARLDDDRFTGLMNAFAPAQQAAIAADTAAAWVTNRAANAGTAAVADELGVERIWIAERDACVHCLGLAGETSVDGVFDATKTFGIRPLAVWPGPDLVSPPRHPRCRCRTQPWLGTRDSAGDTDFRAALQREAARSILTGWRLPSESERVRLDAAERLLLSGTTLLSTVQARARAAVRRGSFETFPRIKSGARTR
ncbi:hypothetical protein BBK82_03250 [Lentzea guizhouensis]|uniref:Phage head morphogenesis domain-containing protein n=1 Tax=Lentzea guizhouensis TaxID=1586287 RepID=A0A1B2HBZ1_9PSEU|nr:hypothetical protein [Lentzea guizhouensis]ANZ35234.1 hypothetical protein BBK82_03250 [Lentzea guizhouensis]